MLSPASHTPQLGQMSGFGIGFGIGVSYYNCYLVLPPVDRVFVLDSVKKQRSSAVDGRREAGTEKRLKLGILSGDERSGIRHYFALGLALLTEAEFESVAVACDHAIETAKITDKVAIGKLEIITFEKQKQKKGELCACVLHICGLWDGTPNRLSDPQIGNSPHLFSFSGPLFPSNLLLRDVVV